MKVQRRRSRGRAPINFNLGSRWKLLADVTFRPLLPPPGSKHRYPLNKRPHDPFYVVSLHFCKFQGGNSNPEQGLLYELLREDSSPYT